MRKSDVDDETVYVLCNFADETRESYTVGVPYAGEYVEIFNSQSTYYEGWNIGNSGPVRAKKEPMHGREYSITLTLPPLGVIYLKRVVKKSLLTIAWASSCISFKCTSSMKLSA